MLSIRLARRWRLATDPLMLQAGQPDKVMVLPWAMRGLLIGAVPSVFDDRD